MKRGLLTLIILTAIMLAGGALTTGIFTDSPIIIQSMDPNASVFEATPEQANLFFFWVIFVLSNMVIIGGILAVVLWRGNAAVSSARAEAAAAPETASE